MGMEHPHAQKVTVWHSLHDQEAPAPPRAADLSWEEVIVQIHQVMAAFATTRLTCQGSTGDEEHDA